MVSRDGLLGSSNGTGAAKVRSLLHKQRNEATAMTSHIVLKPLDFIDVFLKFMVMALLRATEMHSDTKLELELGGQGSPIKN